MSADVKISVVMPVYNSRRFLPETVKSVLDQSYAAFELILVDDCSTDGSGELMEELALSDSRIRILKNRENLGVAKTRNAGIAAACGNYIALLDSDDIWTVDKLQRQIDLALKENCDIVYCSYGFIDESGAQVKKPFLVPERTCFKDMLAKSVISCSTALIKAELLKDHPFDPNIYHEDYALWMKLLALPVKALGDTQVLAYYRQVSGSRNARKFHAAQERWKIYRDVLHLSYAQSVLAFFRYAAYGIKKYYLT